MSTFRQKVQATTNWVKPAPEDLVEAPRRAARASRARKQSGPPVTPVTTHRLFPALVAVWFAALFGLGSLAVPASVLGALVVKTGLPALVPAAAPPLGFTAHLLVALMLTAFGAAIGLVVALRLRPARVVEARPVETVAPAAQPEADDVYKVRARDAHPDAPPRRPLVLTEAFAGPPFEEAAPAEQLLRRKTGLPVSEPVADALPWIPEFTPGGTSASQPLDLSALDLSTLDLADPAEVPVEQPPLAAPDFQPAAIPVPPALIAATPQLPAGCAAALPDVTDGQWSPVAGAPLESLGLVQLIERLAHAIAAQKAANAAIVGADPISSPEADVVPAEAEREPQPAFEPGPFSQPRMADVAADFAPAEDVPAAGSAREAILRRLGAMAAGDFTEEAGSPAASVPLFSRPASLSANTSTEAVVALRPAVMSSPDTAAPLETDEALRSALATLQRMTARG